MFDFDAFPVEEDAEDILSSLDFTFDSNVPNGVQANSDILSSGTDTNSDILKEFVSAPERSSDKTISFTQEGGITTQKNVGEIVEEVFDTPIDTKKKKRKDDYSPSNLPLIEFRGVYKTYDNGTKALSDVNLRINKGEFVFVVGKSGSGKSTFIKLMMHEEKPNAGEIIVNGYKMSSIKRREVPKLRRSMGIVFQDFRLIPTMTVFENVAFAMRVTGASSRQIRKRVSYALNIVGLGDKARSRPTELSGGEQQRVGLARALVNNPSLIIADEPTGNVDPAMSYEIVELLTEINRRGTTIVMVTHEHQLVRDFNRRVIMIDHGTVVADSQDGGIQ
ncbi:MAG: cell division ATP-binding protein FtsE [Clostridia bacterium]|nr:cell division ATP-binding protein FtsE [Clostridia bacterium]